MPGPPPCHYCPCVFCIVGRGLDRLTAHNERRQPAKLAHSCGCLPRRGKHCSLPGFAPLNRGPTLTTPHLRGASRTPPPTGVKHKVSHCRKRARWPEGWPPYMRPGNISSRSAAKHPRAVKLAQGCFYLLSFPRHTPRQVHWRTRRADPAAGSACTRAWPRPHFCCRPQPRPQCGHP